MCDVVLKYREGGDVHAIRLDIPVPPGLGQHINIYEFGAQHPNGKLDRWFLVIGIAQEINAKRMENP